MKNQKNKRRRKTKQTITTTTKTSKETHKDKRQNKNKTLKRDPPHFSELFFTCSLPVFSSKSLEHNPFTLLKLCYLLNAIFF